MQRSSDYEDGFSERKRKYYRIIVVCVIIFGGFLGILCGIIILDAVSPTIALGENQEQSLEEKIRGNVRQKKLRIEDVTTQNFYYVQKAILKYRATHTTPPASLDMLVEQGLITQKQTLDAWNRPFVYTPYPNDDAYGYELCSLGEDGILGTDDDIIEKP